VDHRRVGELEISVIGLGCNAFGHRVDSSTASDIVNAALAVGITFFDTADVYGRAQSEAMLGHALGKRRADVVVATKFGYAHSPEGGGGKPAWVRKSLESSLRKLQTDWIDLYQFHRPDPDTPIEDTLGTLDELVSEGKIRAYGCSQFGAWHLRSAVEAATRLGVTGFQASQNEYSLLRRDIEDELLPIMRASDIALLPYFPLAAGLLTGKYRRGEQAPDDSRFGAEQHHFDSIRSYLFTDRTFDLVNMLSEFARARGHTLAELALAWLCSEPCVGSVIAGATSVQQVRANARAATWQLDDEELTEVARLTDVPLHAPNRA
jgi:aryl-alcohol dehydrogenase-like predicted oxidoreductase